MLSESASNVLLLVLNVGSTVGIVSANKQVLTALPFAMVLTLCHTTVSVSIVSTRTCALRPEKPMPWYVNTWFSFLTIGCIYIQNVSLRINTVTFYQISKLMVIPTQCVWQYFSQSKVFSGYVYSSLFVLSIGVGLSTAAELKTAISVSGVIVAATAVIVVVLEQAETGRLRARYELTSMDFLLSTGPYRTVGATAIVLASERDALPTLQTMSVKIWAWLFLSCLLATSINITVVQIIGKFGPVTTAVVGHVKTISILLVGFYLKPPAVDFTLAKNLTGIMIALTAAIKYGQYTSFPDADCFARCRQEKQELPDLSTDKPESDDPSWSGIPLLKKVLLLAFVMVVITLSLLIFPTVSATLLSREWMYASSLPSQRRPMLEEGS